MSNGTNTRDGMHIFSEKEIDKIKEKILCQEEQNFRKSYNLVQNAELITAEELSKKHIELKLKYISQEYFINNCRSWLAFFRDIILGGVITCVIVKHALRDNIIGQLVDF